MPRISKINPENASPEVRAAIDAHLSEGYRLTNEKLTLLHNVTAFNALEAQSYALDREFQRLVGKRAADFFEYAISLENDCLVCSRYFAKLLRQNGIEDVERSAFSEETIMVATAMGVFMIANNVFNDALQVEPEEKA